jgi:hypothetical protein
VECRGQAIIHAMRKTTRRKRTTDKHKSGFLVRLPGLFRPPLAKLRERHRRAITVEVQIALEKHLAAEGVWPPDGGK